MEAGGEGASVRSGDESGVVDVAIVLHAGQRGVDLEVGELLRSQVLDQFDVQLELGAVAVEGREPGVFQVLGPDAQGDVLAHATCQ